MPIKDTLNTASAPLEPRPRHEWIDTTKGLAILLVIIAHSSFWIFGMSHDDIRIIPIIRKSYTLAIASFMPIFYVLSGYTFSDRSHILMCRFKRLLYPYVIWGIISLAALYIIPLTDAHLPQQSFCQSAVGLIYSKYFLYSKDYTSNIYLLPANAGQLWFLTSLFTSYICFLALVRYKRFSATIIVTYLIATLVLSFCPILLPWSIDMAPLGALFLFAGYRLKQSSVFSKPTWKLALIASLLFPLYFLSVYYNGSSNMSIRHYGCHTYLSPFLFIIIGLIGSFIYCSVGIFLQRFNLHAPFSYLGKLSLTLLCCHNFIYYIMDFLYSRHCFNIPLSLSKQNLYFLLQITSVIIFSIILSLVSKNLNTRFKR